jgi:hypothetical protein
MPPGKEVLVLKSLRFSIAGLMGAVGIAALSAAALRAGSEARAGIVFLIAAVCLNLGFVGLVCRKTKTEQVRYWWSREFRLTVNRIAPVHKAHGSNDRAA